MASSIRDVDPRSTEYNRDYANGWNAGQRCAEDTLSNADRRGVSHAWYDGYHDAAAGRLKWTFRVARRRGFESLEEMYQADEMSPVRTR